MKPIASLRIKLAPLALALLLAGSAGAQAANYPVNTNADSGAGSLRDAITQANANPGADTIGFDPALTAFGPATISLTSALPDITDSLTITGPGQTKLTLKNGIADPNNPEGNPAGLFRILTAVIDAPRVVSVTGLTMTNGVGNKAHPVELSDQLGGGMVNSGTGTLNVTDCTITGNYANYAGGGIGNLIGTVNVTRCAITGNTTQNYGGGLGMFAPPGSMAGTLRIDASVISGNRAQARSGGIIAESGTITMTNSIVDSNSSQLYGGVSMSGGGTLSIDRSTISNNQATNGLAGGISVIDTTTIVSNSTISGNTVTGTGVLTPAGAGLFVEFGTTTLTNCTVANNQWLGGPNGTLGAGGMSLISNDSRVMVNINNCTISGNSSFGGPGGLLNRLFTTSTPRGSATVNIRSSILAGNTSAAPANPAELSSIAGIISQGNNIVGDNEMTPVPPVAGDQAGVTAAQLNIAALADNGGLTKTMALLPGSVALDKGIANGLTTDQRGYGRAFDNAAVANAVDGADVGAFEAQSLTFVVTRTADAGPGSLRDALTQANLNPDADTITFAIPTSDPGYDAASQRWTISLTSALPVISDSVTISGPGKDKLTVKNGLVDPNDPIGSVDPNNFIFNPASVFRVFTLAVDAPGVASFSGLTVSHGLAFRVGNSAFGGQGGGILNSGSGTLDVADCAITKNFANEGGSGIANFGTGTLNVTRCTVSGNGMYPILGGASLTAGSAFGGGISNGGVFVILENRIQPGGAVRIEDSVISGNGGGGSGIGSYAGFLVVINSTVTGNRGAAGGILASLGSVSIHSSTVSDNQSEQSKSAGGLKFDHSIVDLTNSTINGNIGTVYGNSGASIAAGGIYNIVSTVNLTNCTLTNNQAISIAPLDDPNGPYGVSGGAIANDGLGSTFNIFNCTISGNSNDNGPGGILNRGQPANGTVGVVNIRSSIVAGNISVPVHYPPTGARIFAITSLGYNVIGDNEIMPVTPVIGDQAGVTAAQLNLGPLANNGGPTQTMALGLGSVAINRGFANASLLPNDQRGAGFARIVGAAADAGAFEVQNTAPVAKAKNIVVPAGSNCQASITPQQVDNGSFDPDSGDTLILSLDQSGPFVVGPRTVTLTATDRQNLSSSATATVTVVDRTPPLISSVTANPNTLKPADNKLKPVTLSVSAADGCGGAITSKITSVNFVDPAKGDKADDDARKMKPAFQLTGDLSVKLLAGPKGRVYTLTVASTDSAGNAATKTTSVTVAPPPPPPPPPRH